MGTPGVSFDKGWFRVETLIGRHPADRKKMAVVRGGDGRRAVTRFRVERRLSARAALIRCRLETGRTHQIRVHLASLGHPVVGDATYGAGGYRGMSGPVRGWARELERRVPRQFLHAARLRFRHPTTRESMTFSRALPPDLAPVAAWARRTSMPDGDLP